MQATDCASVTVTCHQRTFAVEEGVPFEFGRGGRRGVLGLDPTDTGISRTGGRIRVTSSEVTLTNMSTSRLLFVEHPSIVRHQRVEPGGTLLLATDVTVLVPGKVFTHDLLVTIPPAWQRRNAVFEAVDTMSLPTDTGDLCSNEDRRALAGLAAGYLARWPRHDPNPRSYEKAAVDLGVTEAALRRRIDHLRERLAARGTLEASGVHALRALIEWAIDNAVVGCDDLARIRPSEEPEGRSIEWNR